MPLPQSGAEVSHDRPGGSEEGRVDGSS